MKYKKKFKNISMAGSAAMSAGYSKDIPATGKIFAWAEDLVNMGPRVVGTETGKKAQKYVADQLRAMGIVDIDIVGNDTLLWKCDQWSLEVAGKSIDSYFMTNTFNDGTLGEFATPEGGVKAEVVYVGDGTEKDYKKTDVKGKIVMSEVHFSEIPIGLARLKSYLFYDPDKTFSLFDKKLNPYSANTFPYNYFRAMNNGAVGFIGILTDYIDSNKYNNEDYSYMEDKMRIPGLWITKKHGEEIKNLINIKQGNGSCDAKIEMQGSITKVRSGAVIGILPGMSDEMIMVQSHYDSSTAGGTEDASGTAVVLALADFYSKVKKEDRPRSLMFTLMDTHFSDYDSHDAVIEKYLYPGNKVVANVSIEHLSREFEEKDGQFVYTGLNEPNIVFVSDNKAMLDIAKEEYVRHDLKRSVLMRTDAFGEDVPTDSDMFYRAGVPIISSVSGPIYLYDEADTLDKIDIDAMKPTTAAYADIIWRLSRVDKGDLK